jgi:hypothetical protein
MAGWVALITALTASVSVIIRLVLQYRVTNWSLRADQHGQQHAIELLEVLQNDRLGAIGRFCAAACRPRRLPGESQRGQARRSRD